MRKSTLKSWTVYVSFLFWQWHLPIYLLSSHYSLTSYVSCLVLFPLVSWWLPMLPSPYYAFFLLTGLLSADWCLWPISCCLPSCCLWVDLRTSWMNRKNVFGSQVGMWSPTQRLCLDRKIRLLNWSMDGESSVIKIRPCNSLSIFMKY